MSRAQENGPEMGQPGGTQDARDAAQTAKPGGQAAQKVTGATGTGTTSGAAASGPTSGTTTTAVRDRERASMPAQGQARGTAPSAGYRTGGAAGTSTAGMTGGVLAVLTGALTFLAGLAAVVRRSFYPNLGNYAYHLDVRSWGWIMLVIGAVLFAVGACALLGMAWARFAAVGLAVITAIAGFLFLAYTPVWGTILVLLSVVTIWGLLRGSSADRDSSMM
jgi:hypothetical protein